jgi:hypothetical protein
LQPNLANAFGCGVIFDAAPEELFPGVFSRVEWQTLERVWDLHQRFQSDRSAAAKAASLQVIIERIMARSEQQDT